MATILPTVTESEVREARGVDLIKPTPKDIQREQTLVNALLEIRDEAPSGSYEMSVVDTALVSLGYTRWKAKLVEQNG